MNYISLKRTIIVFAVLGIVGLVLSLSFQKDSPMENNNLGGFIEELHPLSIEYIRQLTIPQGIKPKNGWPVIIFNHGYISPDQYRTTERNFYIFT